MDNVQRKINKMLSYYTVDTPSKDAVRMNALAVRTAKAQAKLNEQGRTERQDTITNRNTKVFRKMKTF